jgi:hypothetical protein
VARFCSECGAPLEPEAPVCGSCGFTVRGEAASVASREPEPVERPTAASVPVAAAAPSASPAGGARGRHWGVVLVAMVVILALVGGAVYWFAIRDDSSSAGELFLEPAASTGRDPFTGSTATGTGTTGTSGTTATTNGGGAVTGKLGSEAGLYGGSLGEASCDVEKQIAFLEANADKASAFAGVLGIAPSQIPAYLRGLTSVVLRSDTRVTNHGFVDGKATARQSVLQAGTAVLVDELGVPRVRCRCGNPLTPPTAISGDVVTRGDAWAGYGPGATVVVRPGDAVAAFTLVDHAKGTTFDRPVGTDGSADVGGSADQLTVRCGATPDDTVSDLLRARRAGDRASAVTCASQRVVDYLFSLNTAFASTLTAARACTPASSFGLSGVSADAAACPLTNNAVLVVERSRPRTEVGWIATQVVLVEQPPGGTTTTAASACTKPWVTPAGEGERTLVAYFTAIDARDYSTAFALLSPSMQADWNSPNASDGLASFSNFMGRYVRCVRVTGIHVASNSVDPEVSASLGIQWYAVDLDASYLQALSSSAGVFAPYYKVRADPHTGANRPPNEILASATGL